MASPTPGGFSLFPNPNSDPRPPSRSQSRPRPASPPQDSQTVSSDATPPRRRGTRRGSSATREESRTRTPSTNPWQHALDAKRRQQAVPETSAAASTSASSSSAPPVTSPTNEDPVVSPAVAQPVTDAPQRCETAFSEANTLVRSSSQRSRSSIAKPPIAGPSSPSSSSEPVAIRSIFPVYNPDLPLSQQPYYPTEVTSPTHIPQSAISRPLYAPRNDDIPSPPPRTANPPGVFRSATVAAPSSPTLVSPNRVTRSNTTITAATTAVASTPAARWPPLAEPRREPNSAPPFSSTEDLRTLWKVTNGWRATASEGRVYCLRLAASTDPPPSYTLSSASGHPFYCLRVDPTSSSALVSLSRYDPNKNFKPASSGTSSLTTSAAGAVMSMASSIIGSSRLSSSGNNGNLSPGGPSFHDGSSSPSPRASSSSRHSDRIACPPPSTAHTPATTAAKYQKNWHEVLSTKLNPLANTPSSRPTTSPNPTANPTVDDLTALPESEGLICPLFPLAAARLVTTHAHDPTTVALAQQECARLVYDADSGSYFLAHPALAMPFRVAIERFPAYSRNEYALEHIESAAPLARLVREGHGAGWVEVDTGVAGRAEAVYLVDVAVAALLVVAHLDAAANAAPAGAGVGWVGAAVHQAGVTEVFEPPPVVLGGPNGSLYSGRSSRQSRRREERERKRKEKRGSGSGSGAKRAFEQFEIDLESQTSDLKAVAREKKKELPFVLRMLVSLVTCAFKCLFWCATIAFKALWAILSGLARCCGLGKL
ncbi:hypothetical protein VTJ04DRAFT_3255 [Mycothermus thermophilus]|uniref:uncharacterized protein n=1 Tax=Humicola insolens TaxID=85995 RepID=UPI003742FF0B